MLAFNIELIVGDTFVFFEGWSVGAGEYDGKGVIVQELVGVAVSDDGVGDEVIVASASEATVIIVKLEVNNNAVIKIAIVRLNIETFSIGCLSPEQLHITIILIFIIWLFILLFNRQMVLA